MTDPELTHVALAAASLGDRLAIKRNPRLDDIERALSRPLPPEERRALRREYLQIWDEVHD